MHIVHVIARLNDGGPARVLASLASGYKLIKHTKVLTEHHDLIVVLVIGFVVSFLVAWVAVAWLLRYIANHTFVLFGWYRIGAALLLVLLLLGGYLTFTD